MLKKKLVWYIVQFWRDWKKNLTRYLKKKKRENARKIFHKILHCIKPLQDDCILQSSYEGVVDMKKIVRHTENSPNLVRSIAFGRRWTHVHSPIMEIFNIYSEYKIRRNKITIIYQLFLINHFYLLFVCYRMKKVYIVISYVNNLLPNMQFNNCNVSENKYNNIE